MGSVGLAPGLARKLKKVLDCRTDSPDLVSSLNALSSFYSENTPQTRRNLRSTIEKCSLQINVDFLEASRSAQLALDLVEEEVNALAESCDVIAKALNGCSASTGIIISTTDRLKQELEVTTQRQDVVSCFLRDYQLSSEELSALKDEELNDNFFKALVHVQEIHSNCKLLLRTHHQRAGLELMDMMAVYQEGAFERLCRWVQAECRRLSDSDNPDVGDLLKTAVHYLKARPVLFKYCTEEVANIRHNVLFRRFISALTRGGPGGLPRPIEVHAHDPLRYVGDMLGWIHQALASERELVLVLLDSDSLPDAGSKSSLDRNNGKSESDLTSVLDRIFEGVCRPFKVRVEQVLKSLPSLIMAYKLSNTIEFYNYTIQNLIGKDTSLCETIRYLKGAGQKAFFEILRLRGEKLLRYPSVVGVDLSPPQAVREGVEIIDEILIAYNSMMVPESGEILEVNLVISATLDPVVQMCEQAAEAHKLKGGDNERRRLSSTASQLNKSSLEAHPSNTFTSRSPESSSKIFLVNCLSCIQQPLHRYDVALPYTNKLGKMIEDHILSLVNQEVIALLSKSGLSEKMDLFRESVDGSGSGVPLAERDETSPAVLSDCLKTFFGLILGNESPLPEFELLQVPKLRIDASMKVASKVSESYQVMYAAITDPKNGYSDPRSLARHQPSQITTILGL